jgi:putative FmdB family regulatory protein
VQPLLAAVSSRRADAASVGTPVLDGIRRRSASLALSRTECQDREERGVPTYQYRCTDCGEPLEVVQSFTDDALTVCPACNGTLRKVFSSVGVVFKGSGFYRTDSRAESNPAAKADTAASATETKTDTKSETKSDANSDTKSDAKSDTKPAKNESKPAKSESTATSSAA